MKCTKCGSEDIIVYEYRGAYDGWLVRGCNTCGIRELKESRYYILASEQIEEYAELLTIAQNKEGDIKRFVNMRPYEEPFVKKNERYDNFFDNLWENIEG